MIKRTIDITVSLVGLAVFAPLFLLIALLIKLDSRGPVFFKQVRIGKGFREFTLYKFRTMVKDFSGPRLGQVQEESQHLTRVGGVLRKYRLNELPQLMNVLKGDMSLVGPRPLLMEYLPLYNKEQLRRHEVRPGVTGWAQVNGRNAISWEQKFKLDVWYVENQSFWLDIKILLLTVIKVIDREGISSRNHETMEKFTGNG